MDKPVLRTPLCDFLGCDYPIMLAGMSKGPTNPELVAAVSDFGGFGVMGLDGFTPEDTRSAIHQIRDLTDRPFGVDLLLPVSRAEVPDSREEVIERIQQDYPKHWGWIQDLHHELGLPDVQETDPHVSISAAFIEKQVEVILQERVPLFCAALGDPSWIVPEAHAVGTKVLGLAGSGRNAIRQKEAGVDIIVAQGSEAGGHVGRIGNFVLIPEVIDAVSPIPVVAAGGIADGRSIAAALCLGAVGVWCGTAFLFSEETGIGEAKQQQLIEGQVDDFVVSRSYTGKTARNYRNVFMDQWAKSGLEALPMPLQGVLVGSFVKAATLANRWDLVNNPAGQVAGLLSEIKPAKKIMEEMVQGTINHLTELPDNVTYSRSDRNTP